ncbi:hypothetical protein [Micromonospora sp. NBC_01813]|uniref:hypothetical protein n=1 Tax=Micromonospora sp. NBC_01813 TaxID=2975988 RepID=UPI002DDBA96C|nr:hypothetical protein [Micromonospora sp. NBC_01813]WSA08244.1 hypothetical protein OG958_29265 [Micromonospora sp. NBC_01813]
MREFSVRPAALREAAGGLAGLGQRLGHGLADQPAFTVAAPGWAAADLLAEVAAATHRQLTGLGAEAATTGQALVRAADEYDAADGRAAHRLTR